MTELEQLVLDAYKQGMTDAQETIAGTFDLIGQYNTDESELFLELGSIVRNLNVFAAMEAKGHPPERFRDIGNGE